MKNLKQIIQYSITLSLALVLVSCGSIDNLAPSRVESKPYIRSTSPDILKSYKAFYLSDIQLTSLEGDVLRRVNNKEVINLANEFRSKLIRNLGSKHTQFPQPAKNVAIIKVVISDVSTTYALFQIYPGVVVPNALRGGASIEAKILDSVTGKELVLYRDSRQGEREGFLSGLGKWDGVKKAFDEWAAELAGAVN